MVSRSHARLVITAIACTAAPLLGAPSFTPVGDASEPILFGYPALSADGSTVVGTIADTDQPFRWTRATGLVPLGIAGPPSGFYATAVSGDGSTVVGQFGDGTYTHIRWTAAGGFDSPLDPTSPENSLGIGTPTGISADGSVIVGLSYTAHFEPFRWTASSGSTYLGYVPGGAGARANAVSADGSTVVGFAYLPGDDIRAFRWTAATGLQLLPDLPSDDPDHDNESEALAASADGSVIVGNAGPEHHAVRWTAAGVEELSTDFGSAAYGVSPDGTTIVGGGQIDGSAFIWDPDHGYRDLQSLLANDLGLGDQLAGWTLYEADGISADKATILGRGLNPDGKLESFVAVIPEPAVITFLAPVTVFVRSRRPRSTQRADP
jgi:uncharacterized membrane protein